MFYGHVHSRCAVEMFNHPVVALQRFAEKNNNEQFQVHFKRKIYMRERCTQKMQKRQPRLSLNQSSSDLQPLLSGLTVFSRRDSCPCSSLRRQPDASEASQSVDSAPHTKGAFALSMEGQTPINNSRSEQDW